MDQTTPLLANLNGRSSTAFLDVSGLYSKLQKRFILSIVSIVAFVAPFASSSFIPCVPEIAKELHTSGTVINYTIGAYTLLIALGELFWAPYAEIYGRKRVYLMALPFLLVGSLGATRSQTVPQLMVSRAFQAFGASFVTSVGSATISDIFMAEERAGAMGVFHGVSSIGPMLGPFMGGLLTEYASWRIMQWIVFAMGTVAFFCIALLLPETVHLDPIDPDDHPSQTKAPDPTTRKKALREIWRCPNPFKSLKLLIGPYVSLVAVSGALTQASNNILLVPMSYTLASSYDIKNPAVIGFGCFILGAGNCVGIPLARLLSESYIIKKIKNRGSAFLPEDRLKATLPAALVSPVSVLVFGLVTEYIPGKVGIAIDLICLFINGVAVAGVVQPSSEYHADNHATPSAEAFSIHTFLQNILGGIVSAAVLPVIDRIGVGATNWIAAIMGWIGFALLWITVRHGDKMRALEDHMVEGMARFL